MREMVIVYWKDALVNIGFLVDESDEGIIIASECSIHDEDYLRHFVFIPWVNVTKIEELVDA